MKTDIHIRLIVLLCLFAITNIGTAQDGKSLFETNCSACHHPTKNGVGPALKGVKEKWAENAATEDLIYIWVNNWQEAADMDPYAAEAAKLKSSEMNNFNLSKEEIDAILDYVDNPPVAAQENTATGQTEQAEVVIPDYKRNLNIMIVLITVGLVLIFYILTMVHTIKMVTGSKYFRNKEKGNGGALKTLIVLLGLSLMPAAVFAQSPVLPEPNETFFKITQTDIWYVVVIDLILLGGAMYMRYIFRQIVSMKTEPVKLRFFRKRPAKSIKRVFNNAVPIEEERDILMDHEYDGIRELDNRLPPWWLYMFYATIVFAVIYVFHFHVFKTGDLQITAYNKEMKQAEAEVQEYLKKMALDVDENTVVLLMDDVSLSEGKALYETNCVICHGDKGQGGNGANLSDNHWIYGNRINDIFRTIKYGGQNGMKAWKDNFNPVEIQKIASYVAISLDQMVTPEMGGKIPEGDFYDVRIAGASADSTQVENTDSLMIPEPAVLTDSLDNIDE